MSRFHSYINSATTILESYHGDKPFAIYLKQYFASNKRFGSNDRKQVAALCYNYFRLGKAASNSNMTEKLLLGAFLCEQEFSKLLDNLKPEWNEHIGESLSQKTNLVADFFKLTDIFPFREKLSAGIDHERFCTSFLVQPSVFLRIRPAATSVVEKKLSKSGLSFEFIGDDCVQLPPATNVEEYLSIDKEVVIQDHSSQQVLNFLKPSSSQSSLLKTPFDSWDCCAASGGKSILLKDIFNKQVSLTISDIRASIILNLHQRFKRAGIKEYKYFISDISQPDFMPVSSEYDLVLCDAPCTGSGTWSRTPEQLHFFKEPAITHYSELQRKIVSQSFPHLRSDGLFVYITCSVFRQENEEMTRFIREDLSAELLFEEVLKGYSIKADSMYVSVFRKK
ncbi:MAG: Fmu (Sun) domain-containing protein [Bacteroidota bacterium]